MKKYKELFSKSIYNIQKVLDILYKLRYKWGTSDGN